MAPDDSEVEGAMGVYLRAALPRLRGLERSPLNRAAAWLQARLLLSPPVLHTPQHMDQASYELETTASVKHYRLCCTHFGQRTGPQIGWRV